jgi:phosphate transport system protein
VQTELRSGVEAGQANPGTPAGPAGVGDPTEGHTVKSIDRGLADLRLLAVQMGGLVIDQVGTAVRSLLEHDVRLAELVLHREQLVNDYDEQLDRDSLRFIALQHPVANDLRVVRGLARVGLELERCGDEAKKVARFAAQFGKPSAHDPVVAVARSLRHMADLSGAMLRNALRAMDEFDGELAERVLAQDRELDEEFATGLRLIMTFALQDQAFLKATVDTVFALKGLERIGDHAKNIAEQVLYMVRGEDPQHLSKAG